MNMLAVMIFHQRYRLPRGFWRQLRLAMVVPVLVTLVPVPQMVSRESRALGSYIFTACRQIGIYRTNVTGGSTTLVTDPGTPIQIHATDSYLYFTGDGKVRRTDHSGAGLTTMVTASGITPIISTALPPMLHTSTTATSTTRRSDVLASTAQATTVRLSILVRSRLCIPMTSPSMERTSTSVAAGT